MLIYIKRWAFIVESMGSPVKYTHKSIETLGTSVYFPSVMFPFLVKNYCHILNLILEWNITVIF